MILTIAKLSGGIKQHVLNLQSRSKQKFINLTYSQVCTIPLPFFRALSFLLFGLFRGLSLIRKNKIDAIHAHYLLPSGLLGLFLSKLTRKPLIVTIHGSDAHKLPYLNWLKHIITKNAKVLCVSKALTKQFPGTVIPNGIDPKELDAAKEISLKHPAILFVGALIPSKVSFLSKVISQMPEANFYVLGSGPLAGKTGGIELPSVTHSELFNYYKSCDCFISTSEWEGFGLSVLEAMASGTPVIVRPVGALKELVNSQGTFASTPDEFVKAIRQIIKTHPSTTSSKKYARQFTWNSSAKKLDSIYDDIGQV